MSTIPEKKKLIIDPGSNFDSQKTWRAQTDAINLFLISSCNCEQSWFVGTKLWYTDTQLHLFPQIQASPRCSRVKLWDFCSCQQLGNLTQPGKRAQPRQPLCARCSWTWWERTAKHGCNRAGSRSPSQACTYQLDYSQSRRVPSLLWNPSTLACPLALASRHSHHSSFCPKRDSFISHSIIIHTVQHRFSFSMKGAEIVKTVQKLVEWDEMRFYKNKKNPKHELEEQKLYAFVQCNFVYCKYAQQW